MYARRVLKSTYIRAGLTGRTGLAVEEILLAAGMREAFPRLVPFIEQNLSIQALKLHHAIQLVSYFIKNSFPVSGNGESKNRIVWPFA
jgi:hypothetical protein